MHCTAYPWSPFIDAVCLKPLLSKSLSLVIVTSSCFLKLPVIRNVLNIWSKSFTKAGKLKVSEELHLFCTVMMMGTVLLGF